MFDNPSAPASFWSALPLGDFASGTGLVTARSDWGSDPTWVATQIGNLLNAGHQFVPGQMEINRGADQLLINAYQFYYVYGNGSLTPTDDSFLGNIMVINDPTDERNPPNMGVWFGTPGVVDTAYENTAAFNYVDGNYAAAYSPEDDPGSGGQVSQLTRQVVFVRPDLIFVYDRATTNQRQRQQDPPLAFPECPNRKWQQLRGDRRQQPALRPGVLDGADQHVSIHCFGCQPWHQQRTVHHPAARYREHHPDHKRQLRHRLPGGAIHHHDDGSVRAHRQRQRHHGGCRDRKPGGPVRRSGPVAASATIAYSFNGKEEVQHLLVDLVQSQTYEVIYNGSIHLISASNQGTLTFSTPAGVGSVKVIADTNKLSKFSVSGLPGSITAGSDGTFTVTALNSNGSTDNTYTGTVHFTSSDIQAGLPANYTFTLADAGVHTFSAILKTAGTQSITVKDTATGISDSQIGIVVDPAAASRLSVHGYPSPITAGVAGSFSITALDPFGNIATGYSGTVQFTSSDAQAVLPTNYTFQASDHGVHTFKATLKTAGTQSITVKNAAAGISDSQIGIVVDPAAASKLSVHGYPSPITAGVAGSFSVTALDPFGNIATGYSGTVQFTSSDAQAVLPTNYTFQASDHGVHTFKATLKTAGTQLITVKNAAAGISDSQIGIVVDPAAASRLSVHGYPSPITAGVAGSFSVTALDPFGNIATGYRGTVHFTSSDAQAVLPTNYTFQASDHGVHTFKATLETAGTQSITAKDISAGFGGSDTGITVTPSGGAVSVPIAPSPVTSGIASSTTLPSMLMRPPAAVSTLMKAVAVNWLPWTRRRPSQIADEDASPSNPI